MGNAEILNQPHGTPVEPPSVRVLWTVYLLRDQGVKLSKDRSLCTGQVGVLRFWRPSPDKLNAMLTHPSGYPTLGNLYDVRVMPNDEAGSGLLLHGTVLSVRAGVATEIPQGWWCMVHSAQPLQKE